MMRVRRTTDGKNRPALVFLCPGCRTIHPESRYFARHFVCITPVDGVTGPVWTWNGDTSRPTLSPSILVTNGKDYRCHSFVRDGRIEFLVDCSHAMAGQTVDLPEFDESRDPDRDAP